MVVAMILPLLIQGFTLLLDPRVLSSASLHQHEARSNAVGMALRCRGTGMHRVDARENVIRQGGKDEGAKNSSGIFYL
jgi:hypothetical protein